MRISYVALCTRTYVYFLFFSPSISLLTLLLHSILHVCTDPNSRNCLMFFSDNKYCFETETEECGEHNGVGFGEIS